MAEDKNITKAEPLEEGLKKQVLEGWKQEETDFSPKEIKKSTIVHVPNNILSNIGRRKTTLDTSFNGLRLFFDEEEEPLLFNETFIEETSYTPEQKNLIYALLPFLSDEIEKNPSIKEYIKKLNSDLIQRQYNGGAPLPGRVPIICKITDLARLRYGIPTGKVDNSLKNRLYHYDEKTKEESGELYKLSRLKKTFTIKGEGVEMVLRGPLIYIGPEASVRYIDKNGNKIVKERAVQIIFEDIFLFELLDKYASVPREYFVLRPKCIPKTEVAGNIESYLLQWRGDRLKKYTSALDNLQKKKGEGLNEEDVLKEEEKIKHKLDIDISEVSITESLSTSNYYKDTKRRKYLNIPKLRKDIENANNALIEMGLISGWKTGKTKKGGVKYIYTYKEK